MAEPVEKNLEKIMRDLQERRKELNCLYKLEKVFSNVDIPLDETFNLIIQIIPMGWQFPDNAQVQIRYLDHMYTSGSFVETPWKQCSEIILQGKSIGEITVSYRKNLPALHEELFLKEEEQLLRTIANRISQVVLHKQVKSMFNEWQDAEEKLTTQSIKEWKVIIDLLQKTNQNLFLFISQKMLYYLCWNGFEEAKQILQHLGSRPYNNRSELADDKNQPMPKESFEQIISESKKIFSVAKDHLSETRIVNLLRRWIEEDRMRFLIRVVEDETSSLNDLRNAITRFRLLNAEGIKVSISVDTSLRVALIRHFLSDQLDFIKVAKRFIRVEDYYDLLQTLIFPGVSHGKIGGKGAGLFLAHHIIEEGRKENNLLKDIKMPRTWYITCDGLMNFLRYNNLTDVSEQKYKELDEIHIDYQNIIQIFKNSFFSPEIIRGLTLAIDDLGEKPIIVRSSSLLEDRLGSAFSGKYKSLFLANQGLVEKRLEALMDAIAEVYASTFGPDPIAYRHERGLVDFNEEMGILIQEVVGTKIGDYYFPTFAGVAFSRNEFRWSARIKREDGLIRIVPGLGTRAVDRLAEDYPCLIAPGKPKLRVNISNDEIIRYSPKHMDLINLKTNTFETVEISTLLQQLGDQIPDILNVISINYGDLISGPNSLLNIDFKKDQSVVTFEGLLQKTDFISQVNALLKQLEAQMGCPIDIEFAHDGKDFYLLQCRPQSFTDNLFPSPIPKNVDLQRVIFTAHKNISNGCVPDITHMVYVDPDAYNEVTDIQQLKNVGRAIGRINKLLPKRQFVLIGPGRWGSRGDIKMGVDVTYSDINNSAALLEIAKKKGNYIPELSFGTHFFQDLVEASIRYLPLYPDEPENIFMSTFFLNNRNVLSDLLPEFTYLQDIIKVIDVPQCTGGLIVKILMNADIDEAMALLDEPGKKLAESVDSKGVSLKIYHDEFWQWRYQIAERIASQLDGQLFGVKELYVFGSTKNATAGPGSDIDLLIHFHGTSEQKTGLLLWLEGWSKSLAEINYQKTGYRSDGLLDIHLITDEDIQNKTSYAVKIGAITDAAKLLPLKNH